MKKIAVITGASSGLGKDFSLLSPSYFDIDELYIVARREEKLEEVAKKVNLLYPALKVFITPLPLSSSTLIANFTYLVNSYFSAPNKTLPLINKVSFTLPPPSPKEKEDFTLTLLINNAGRGIYGTFCQANTEETIDMLDLNCQVPTALCSFFLPYMKENATIINIASLAAYSPLANFATYAASKSYILHFTLALKAELKKRKITVLAVCPGPTKTEFSLVASKGLRKEVKNGVESVKVARHALLCAKKKKAVSILCFKWKMLAFFSHLAPKYLIAKVTARFFRRPAP